MEEYEQLSLFFIPILINKKSGTKLCHFFGIVQSKLSYNLLFTKEAKFPWFF